MHIHSQTWTSGGRNAQNRPKMGKMGGKKHKNFSFSLYEVTEALKLHQMVYKLEIQL